MGGLGMPPGSGGNLAQPETEPTVGTMSTSEQKVYDWRLEQFAKLGFGETQAEILASTKEADLNRARLLIGRGCPLDHAFNLLV